MTEPEEQTLIVRAKCGDDVAFQRLMSNLVDPAHRLACGLLHDTYLAEDAVQDSAVKAWRKISNLKEGASIRPWFLGIVANQCRELRRGHWAQLITAADISDRPGEPDEDVLNRVLIRQALQRLNRKERLVVVLRLYVDLPWSEVAAIAGTTESGARTRLYRALTKIRPRMAVTT
jgi:RNA polymerase sigma factor (sigma-70 family)